MTHDDAFIAMRRLSYNDTAGALALYRRAYAAGAVFPGFVTSLARMQDDDLAFIREVARVTREVDALRAQPG